MAKALKVYRTAAGFHDAYVAAASKAAALRAWGVERDLFALGAAEEVTDKKLTKAPLAEPGAVIRVGRSGEGEEAPAPKAKRKAAKPAKRPSRAALDKAEAALARVEADFAALAKREAALKAERRKLDAAEAKARSAAECARDTYEEKIAAWRQASGSAPN